MISAEYGIEMARGAQAEQQSPHHIHTQDIPIPKLTLILQDFDPHICNVD